MPTQQRSALRITRRTFNRHFHSFVKVLHQAILFRLRDVLDDGRHTSLVRLHEDRKDSVECGPLSL